MILDRISRLLLVILLLVSLPCQARSAAERSAFMREHPCPSTGATKGKCFGYIVDHVRAICAGGPDKRTNMQWQTVADAKAKDKLERKECRNGR